MNSHIKYSSLMKLLLAFFLFCFILLLNYKVSAQEHPPRPMRVTTTQNLSFGAFIQGTLGGKVIIDPQGSRSVTGDLIPTNMGYSYYPAIFEVDAVPGTIINIVFGPNVTLTGSNGGTLSLNVNTSLPGSPFIKAENSNTQVRIGGTLTVKNSVANPAGNYIGNFSITFVQQ